MDVGMWSPSFRIRFTPGRDPALRGHCMVGVVDFRICELGRRENLIAAAGNRYKISSSPSLCQI
jgi:hypothetical protein